jgi:arylsulfatase A-like enzyme
VLREYTPGVDRRAVCRVLALALGAAACSKRQPPATERHDLLVDFPFADVRADALDLALLLSRPALDHEGWAIEVTEGGTVLASRWTEATLRLPFASTADKELRFTARCRRADAPGLGVAVFLNGRRLADVVLTPQGGDSVLGLPAAAQVAGDNELRFEAAVRNGHRREALRLSALEVRPAKAADQGAPRRGERGLWLPGGATATFYVVRGRDDAVRVTARPAAGEDRLELVVADDGRRQEVASLALRPGHSTTVSAALPPASSPFAALEVRAGGGAWVEQLEVSRPARARPPAPAGGRPSVVVFLMDALRADHLGAYGSRDPASPRFDAFARDAVLFEDASAQSSWTRPTVASLMTGLGVDAHGVDGLTSTLVPEITTLAEAFGAAGYRTGAFVANPVVSPALGYNQGFAVWRGDPLRERPGRDVVRAALAWMDEARGPFLAYVHTLDPHRPYAPSPDHWRPFLFDGYRGRRDVAAILREGGPSLDEIRFVRSAYLGEIRENDAAFGELLDGLRARGLDESTLVAFSADHGEEFYDHGGDGHSGTLYQEVLHVPLAIRLPGSGGRRVAAPVQQMDVMPTLLALAGVPGPEVEGRDLSSACRGAQEDGAGALLVSRVVNASADKRAVRLGRMKLIVNEEPRPSPARLELYDLAQDPGERHNLAGRYPVAARCLRARGAARRAAEEARRARLGAGRTTPMTPEQEEQLRALGYIQ